MLHEVFTQAFERLLETRRRYDEMQRTPDGLPRLAAARIELDKARDRVRRARLMLHPEVGEVAEGTTVVHCDELGRLVNIVPDALGALRCACGRPATKAVPLSR